MTLLNATVGMRFAQVVMSLAQQAGDPASPHTHPTDKPDEMAAPQRATGVSQPHLAINGNRVSRAQAQSNDVARTESIYETAWRTGNEILGSLVRGYLAARDQCDAAAVAELGGRLVGSFGVVHGAKLALDHMLRTLPHHGIPGGTAEEDLALAGTLQAVEAKAPLLDPLLRAVDARVATTMTPHVFHGNEVAGQAVALALDGPPMQRTAKLTGELQRTVGMLVLVDDLKAQLLAGRQGLDRASLQTARTKLLPWASRPLDLAFLRAALGPIWALLDATATPIEAKPSDLLADATRQAKHTGWLGDVGQVDVDNACMELRIGRRENAELVIRQLYTADPDTRARLLIQIKERGLLDALCSAVGWAEIKELHDSLGAGFSEIKTDLQHYFIGKHGYGPDVGHEWERHDRSLHGLVARLGGAGAVLNFALDVGTFGFNSSYGKALDDRSEGRTSEGEASRAKMHAAGRTAAIAAISMLTGGLADKAVRGGATTVSTMRAAGAGAAGGSVGGMSALGASDAYGNYLSGDQQGFSSPEEYVKAALLGGAIGGAISGVRQGLSTRVASEYPPRSAAGAGDTATGERGAVDPVEGTARGLDNATDGTAIRASRAAAIERGYADVTARQAELIEQLPAPGSRIIVSKRAVNVNDLAALTAKTGDEFTVFTRGSQRMVVRGTSAGVDMSTAELTAMREAGWKWSGHTHPGISDLVLNASGHPGDRAVLEIFGQDRSLILNSRGARNVFDQNDNTYITNGGHGR